MGHHNKQNVVEYNYLWMQLIHAKSFPSRGIIPLIEFIGVIKISIYKSNFYLQVNNNQTAMVELSAPSFKFKFPTKFV